MDTLVDVEKLTISRPLCSGCHDFFAQAETVQATLGIGVVAAIDSYSSGYGAEGD